MARSVEDWGERLEEKPTKTVTQIVALITVGIVVLAAAVWGVGVLFSWWKGQGDATVQKNSAQNWIAAQREFHQAKNDVDADKAKIADAKTALTAFNAQNAAPSGDPIAYQQWWQQENSLQTTVTGLQQQCLNTVASYNTDAKSYLTEDWRDASLPDQLDPSACG